MAQPPIIISNGGVASALTKGLKDATGANRDPAEIIKQNVDEINARCTPPEKADQPVAKRLKGTSKARIYWRLANENPHSDETGDAG